MESIIATKEVIHSYLTNRKNSRLATNCTRQQAGPVTDDAAPTMYRETAIGEQNPTRGIGAFFMPIFPDAVPPPRCGARHWFRPGGFQPPDGGHAAIPRPLGLPSWRNTANSAARASKSGCAWTP